MDTKRATRSIRNSELPNGLPLRSAPNEIIDKTDDYGKVLQRRVYDAEGKAAIDFDTSNHGRPDLHPTGAHKHQFSYAKGKPSRGEPKHLTKAELEENNDIIKEGINYNDEA